MGTVKTLWSVLETPVGIVMGGMWLGVGAGSLLGVAHGWDATLAIGCALYGASRLRIGLSR